MIHVEFRDFDDMVGFARQLVGQVQPVSAMNTLSAVQQPAAERVTGRTRKNKPVKEETPIEEETPAEEPQEENGGEPTAQEEPHYSLPDVRAKLAELQKAGKRQQVQALIQSYGVDKLTQIPENRYQELMEKAGEI